MTAFDPQYASDGFERVGVFAVGVPHFVWRVDLDVEFDRELRLIEETVLRLVDAGVGDPQEIASLMGLDDGRMIPTALVDMLRKGALAHRDGCFSLAIQGTEMLARATSRESRRFDDVEFRHDPYRDELRWSFDEHEVKEKELRERGLRALPTPSALAPALLEGRYRELQQLIDRDGLPFENSEERALKRRRELVRIMAVKHYVAYREAELEVWHNATRDEWRWRLLRAGGEEVEASAKLAELEAEGADVIPLEERVVLKLSPQGDEVHAVAESAQAAPEARVLETNEHREALRDAILEARKDLIIVSPWLRTAAVDHELLGWLGTSLERNKEVRITLGYGIARDEGQALTNAARDQQEAVRRLRSMADRVRGRLRLVEVGNTHEKLVVCDDSYVILTSFNFLSFNPRPGRGLRREMGYKITDKGTISDVRRRVEAALRAADRKL